MQHASPLRYPGGKGGFTHFLTDVLQRNDLKGCAYYEPYSGGAGAALNLLRRGVVSRVFLNDADARVCAFWRSMLWDTERFVERILTIPLTIDEWHRQNAICADPTGHSEVDVGFAVFYMNRCNRSGVLSGAGPIGGYQQNGRWRMDARFYRETLAKRALALRGERDAIVVTCQDAISFLKQALPRGTGRTKVFVYLDPPYVDKGQRLYMNNYEINDHAVLAGYLATQARLPWLVSYDDNPLVRKLYARHQLALLPVRYSLQAKRSASELVIAPHHVSVPTECRMHGSSRQLRLVSQEG